MTKIEAKAPGKLMIAGEYSVLFGGNALVAAVDTWAEASFEPGLQMLFYASTKQSFQEQNDHPLWLSVREAAKSQGFFPKAGSYHLNTSAFFDQNSAKKLGLGSSAAAVVALCKIILCQHGNLDTSNLHELAFIAHRHFSHMLGSGADVAASSEAKTILFRRNEEHRIIHPVDLLWLRPHFIFVYTKREQSSRTFVAQAQDYAKHDIKALKAFTASSNLLLTALIKERNVAAINEIFTELYLLLKNFGERSQIDIVSKEHQEIHQLALSLGGSAKPSGAGGGDLSLVFMPQNKELFYKHLGDLGFEILKLRLL